jgi:hypothetical protein
MYAGFATGLPAFLRHRVTPEGARKIIADRLRRREDNFLSLVRLAVFTWPESPYNFIMHEARCEAGDIESLVRKDGLDASLAALERGGIAVTFDEFKARTPIVRNGRTLEVQSSAFDNPLGARKVESQTSGSTGTATRVNMNLDHLAATVPARLLAEVANDVHGLPIIVYRAGLPSSAAVSNILQHFVMGNPVRRWFSPIAAGEVGAPLRFRLAGAMIPALSAFAGCVFPKMETLRFEEAIKVADAAAKYVRDEGGCMVSSPVSTSLTVCLAAAQRGLDLTGVTFMGAAEPASAAKVKGIRAAGAEFVTRYGMSETGIAGAACGDAVDDTDVHLLKDALALVPASRSLAVGDNRVVPFALTSLLPTAPKILINVDVDDFGIVERRQCGCAFGELGLDQHLRQIGSAGKLTGRGITLLGSDVVHLIEEMLPARFGGCAQDYQLVEEEQPDGQSVLTLLVSPSLPIADDRAPAVALYEALSRGRPGASYSGTMLKNADAVRVRRDRPVPNSRGKQPPFRTASVRT